MITRMLKFLCTIVILGISADLVMGYYWPIQDFYTPHSVRSVLDECRGDRDHFHDGIDIDDATTGTVVYAVTSGNAAVGTDYVRVGRYVYIHINPTVSPDSFINALTDTIGTVNSENHLHFGDGYQGSEINPLRSGGISPFNDYESPVIDDIYLLENGTNTVVDPNNVTGPVDIVMKAHDEITDGGSNAGIYKVGYRIESEEINKYQFDNWLTPDCINPKFRT